MAECKTMDCLNAQLFKGAKAGGFSTRRIFSGETLRSCPIPFSRLSRDPENDGRNLPA
jgi:hypothetical protein